MSTARQRLGWVSAIAFAAVLVGLFIGVKATRDVSNKPPDRSNSRVASELREPIPPGLVLSNIGMVDFARLVAAHPLTRKSQQLHREAMSSDPSPDPNKERVRRYTADEKLRQLREQVTKDLKAMVTTCAASRGFWMVFDSSQPIAPAVVVFSSDGSGLGTIAEASAVSDLTPALLQEIARRWPNKIAGANAENVFGFAEEPSGGGCLRPRVARLQR